MPTIEPSRDVLIRPFSSTDGLPLVDLGRQVGHVSALFVFDTTHFPLRVRRKSAEADAWQ